VNVSTLQSRLENRLAIVAGIFTARVSAPQYQAAFIKTYDSGVFMVPCGPIASRSSHPWPMSSAPLVYFDDEKEASLVAEASQWNR
jgi:hypothetical protein